MASFVDQARIRVTGGHGGNGCVSFRREKFVPAGGPNGGDGGKGGDVVLFADPELSTLMDLRYRQHYEGGRGQGGQGANKTGKDGEDLRIAIPPGTLVRDAQTGEVIADLIGPGKTVVIARGGRGGRGNARFASSTNQAPRYAENGDAGEDRWAELELKLLADVGLVGYPNVGKSSLIAAVSAARPKIADYPFTTVVPNLGVVYLEPGESFVVADIPGLIEGAHTGAGLGHEFLRHVERTLVLVHVVDASGSEGRDPLADFRRINEELALFHASLPQKPQIVAANKIDLPGAAENARRLRETLAPEGYSVFGVSAATGEGLRELLYAVHQKLAPLFAERARALEEDAEPGVGSEDGGGGAEGEGTDALTPRVARGRRKKPEFAVVRDGDRYVVSGASVERALARTNLSSEDALRRLYHYFLRIGVVRALREAGAKDGDTVVVGGIEFDFTDETRPQ